MAAVRIFSALSGATVVADAGASGRLSGGMLASLALPDTPAPAVRRSRVRRPVAPAVVARAAFGDELAAAFARFDRAAADVDPGYAAGLAAAGGCHWCEFARLKGPSGYFDHFCGEAE